MSEQPISLVQIARSLSITPGALSNWQRRYEDFPQPAGTGGRRRFYLMSDIRTFMERHDLKPGKAEDFQYGSRDSSAYESKLVEQSLDSMASVAPLGLQPIMAVSTLAIVALESPKGLESPVALARTVSNIDSREADLFGGLRVLQTLPEETLLETLTAWRESAPHANRDRMSYALRRVVRDSSIRKLGAQFTTSDSVARILKAITPGLDILDMCCGYGTTLREFRRSTRLRVGQEINGEAATVARLLARVEGYEIQVFSEDSLAVCHEEWLYNGFHGVIVDPPMGSRLSGGQISPTDLRWTHSGVARDSQAEDYWIQSALAYLRTSTIEQLSRAVVILRNGWFSDGGGSPFRDALLKSGVVEAVIALGTGSKVGSSVPVSILVLRKAGIGTGMVRMIDAQEAGKVHRGVRELETREIKTIATALRGESTSELKSTVKALDVPIQEILQNGSVLDVRRYIFSGGSSVSLGIAVKELNKVVNSVSETFGSIGESFAKMRPTDVLDLDSVSSGNLKLVHIAGSSMESDIVHSYFKTRRQGEEWTKDDVFDSDVVVCLMGIHAGLAVSGKELVSKKIPWPKIWIIRGVNVLPGYLLAWARYGGLERQTKRLVTGSTVSTISTRDLGQITLPIVDAETQRRIAAWGRQLDELSEKFSIVEDIEADFMVAVTDVTAAFFVELDKREAKQ